MGRIAGVQQAEIRTFNSFVLFLLVFTSGTAEAGSHLNSFNHGTGSLCTLIQNPLMKQKPKVLPNVITESFFIRISCSLCLV